MVTSSGASPRFADRPATAAYLELMESCATFLGRSLAPIVESHVDRRLAEADAARVLRGVHLGLLSIEGNYLKTRDPRQATAWLVEGTPARLCWEYLPHAAAYVELVEELGYPVGSVRFETPEREIGMSLDLVVVDAEGHPVVLGEVKAEGGQTAAIHRALAGFSADPGKPGRPRDGGPSGSRREAWKLAHQLWRTRVEWLWLVAAGARSAFRVSYSGGLEVRPVDRLPPPEALGVTLADNWPTMRLPDIPPHQVTTPAPGEDPGQPQTP